MDDNAQLDVALRLVTREHDRSGVGRFFDAAFSDINRRLFGGRLPRPLIVQALTPYGRCAGWTETGRTDFPRILVHPRVVRDGRPALYALLVHELMHVHVDYVLGGWKGRGDSSHNNDLWVSEVNRLAPVLGIDVRAGRQRVRQGKRVDTGSMPLRVFSRFPDARTIERWGEWRNVLLDVDRIE